MITKNHIKPQVLQNLSVSSPKSEIDGSHRFSQQQALLASSFLRTLLYFDVFQYPLSENELLAYCDRPVSDTSFAQKVLGQMQHAKLIGYRSGFYFIGSSQHNIERRIEGNALAAKKMNTARFFSRIISAFPYVRGVYISGSLSKNFMDAESDIDYFIITKPGRLWFTRTLLVMFKRIFLLNSNKYFCINYLIDEENLEVTDNNIYAATEVMLLLPMFNFRLFDDFISANHWCRRYYPNFLPKPKQPDIQAPFLKTLLEKLFNRNLGDYLEKRFHSLSVAFWKKKHKSMKAEDFKRNIHASGQVSRYHPERNQFWVLDEYRRKISEFESRHGFPVSFSLHSLSNVS
jgi:hypothetical protein